MYAAYYGHLKALVAFLRHDPSLRLAKDKRGMAVRDWAGQAGRVLAFCLALGAMATEFWSLGIFLGYIEKTWIFGNMNENIEEGGAVFIHSRSGFARSEWAVVLVVGYLVKYESVKLRDAVEAWLAGGADVRAHDCEALLCNPTCGSELRSARAAPAKDATFAAFLLWLFAPLAFLYGLVFSGLRAARTFLGTRDLATAGRRAAWKSTGELGRRGRTSEISRSVTSKSIRLLFGRIDCRRRVPEAAPRIWRNQPSRTLASKSGRIFDFHAGDGRRTAASRGRSRRSATRSTTSSWNASSSTRSTCATACRRRRARPRAARSSAA